MIISAVLRSVKLIQKTVGERFEGRSVGRTAGRHGVDTIIMSIEAFERLNLHN